MTPTFRRAAILLGTTAIGFGLILGTLAPRPTQAISTNYYLDLHPTANYLTCGWHDGACWDYPTPVASGWALDWTTSPVGSFNAYFYSKSSNGMGLPNAGTATVAYTGGTCVNYTYCVIRDPGGNWHADALYVHTTSTTTGSSFTIASGTYSQTTSYQLGYTANESGCSWTNYHVHQQSGGGWATRLTGNYPDEDYCNSPNNAGQCGVKDINAYAMLTTSWTY